MLESTAADACPAPDLTPDARSVDGDDADEDLARFARALGHPARVRIFKMLAREQTCRYGDIAERLPLAQSTVSQHLKILKEAGLVRGSVDGPRVCYCVEPRELRRLRALVAGI